MMAKQCPHCGDEWPEYVPEHVRNEHLQVCATRSPTLRSLHSQLSLTKRQLHNMKSWYAGHRLRYPEVKRTKKTKHELAHEIAELEQMIAHIEGE